MLNRTGRSTSAHDCCSTDLFFDSSPEKAAFSSSVERPLSIHLAYGPHFPRGPFLFLLRSSISLFLTPRSKSNFSQSILTQYLSFENWKGTKAILKAILRATPRRPRTFLSQGGRHHALPHRHRTRRRNPGLRRHRPGPPRLLFRGRRTPTPRNRPNCGLKPCSKTEARFLMLRPRKLFAGNIRSGPIGSGPPWRWTFRT